MFENIEKLECMRRNAQKNHLLHPIDFSAALRQAQGTGDNDGGR